MPVTFLKMLNHRYLCQHMLHGTCSAVCIVRTQWNPCWPINTSIELMVNIMYMKQLLNQSDDVSQTYAMFHCITPA